MRKISLENIRTGMHIARSIYLDDGKILLGAGVELKDEYIERLHSFNVSEIYIDDELSQNIDVQDIIEEKTRLDAKILVRDIMLGSKSTHYFDLDKVNRMVTLILGELLNNKDVLVNLSDIKTVDDYTFSHSVNVCVLSLVTGIKLGLNMTCLRQLGVGALLHDIGKIMIPEEILKKPSKLTKNEFELIQRHTFLGYQMLKANPNIDISSAYIALGHHERYNGSGYPYQISSTNIHLYARIVAIADVYDAISSDRVYRKKIQVHKVVEYIASLGNQHFDEMIMQHFLPNIAVFPIGTSVLLNTGQKGIVVEVNSKIPAKPIVRIIYNADGTKNNKFDEVDLANSVDFVIINTCEL